MENRQLTKKDYETAIQLQDAVNLNAVLNTFHEVMKKVVHDVQLVDKKGTIAWNTHPIVVLYCSKLASLSSSEDMSAFNKAYERCRHATDHGHPVFEHDCDYCHFLGHYENKDLYCCGESKTGPTVIARISSEPSDYISGLAFVKHYSCLATAYKLAVEEGFLTEKEEVYE